MLTVILSFLKNHWQTALVVSAIVSVVAAFSFQRMEIRHLERSLVRCHAEGVTLENSNKALIDSIQSQNAAIESLETSAKSKKAKLAKALAAARKSANDYALAARHIEEQAMTGEDCGDLKKLVDDFVSASGR